MKWHKGKMYSVSCRQLGTEPTREASWLAANRWWEAKRASIEAVAEADAVPPRADAREVILRALAGRSVRELDALIQQGLAAAKAKKLLEMVSRQGAGPVERLPDGNFVSPMPVPEDALEQSMEGTPRLPRDDEGPRVTSGSIDQAGHSPFLSLTPPAPAVKRGGEQAPPDLPQSAP